MSDLNCLFAEEDQVKEGVILIDLSQIAMATILHTYKEGDKLTTPMVRHLILSTLKFNAFKWKKDGYTKIFICVDNAVNGYWRRDVAYYYKKNRAKAREESNWDWEGYFEGLRTVIDEFKQYMPYYVIDIDKAEADDSIAVLTKKFSLEGHPVMIVSSDGDFTQLHKYPNVKQWSPMQKKLVKSKTGSPALDCMVKIIKGDKKDNVASIKVRSDFWYTHVDGERTPSTKMTFVEECLDAGENIKDLLTEEQYKRFLENRVLIDFDYIREDIVANILDCYNNYQLPGRGKIYSYFVKSGLSKLMKEINNF